MFFDSWVDLKKSSLFVMSLNLTTKSIEGFSLTLQGVDNIHGRHSLATSMLGVSDRVTNDVLEKDLEDTTSLFVNETRDTLDTATTSETTDSRLRDALNVVAKNLAMTLGTSLSKSLSSFATTRHVALFCCCCADLTLVAMQFVCFP